LGKISQVIAKMRTLKVKGLEIKPPKKHSGEYTTPDQMPRAHMVNVTIGKRNSGKTTAMINLIENMNYDYAIVISPTMQSNKELMERLNVRHTFDDPDDPSVVDNIKAIIQKEADDIKRYKEDMRRYNKLVKAMKNPSAVISDEDLIEFFSDGDFQKPEHEWDGRPPMVICLIDDCLGSMLYSKPRKLNALSTYSRHIGPLEEGGAVGISLAFLIQSFKCQTGGLSKTIRNQCTNLIVFKTKDNAEKKDIYDSVAGEIDEDTFSRVYDQAIGTGEDYPFLFIDLHKKPNHPSMFRRRFNEFILPGDIKK